VFVWLISHQPTLLLSQNKPTINNQPEQISIRHQPQVKRTGGQTFPNFIPVKQKLILQYISTYYIEYIQELIKNK
jgi:hypothetical protein